MKRTPYRRRGLSILVCIVAALLLIATEAGAGVLYNNGPLINSRGSGVGGAHESLVQTSLGLTNTGRSVNKGGDDSIADDFDIQGTVAGGIIYAITFFAYQTGSTTESTITGVYFRIWDGQPDDTPNDTGSTVLWGDLTTNRLAHTTWSGIYRLSEATTGTNTDRPIMLVRAAVPGGFSPTAGTTYWIEWQMTGSLASGPWCPYVTMKGLTTTGNAISSGNGGTTWADFTDDGTSTVQGAPFILHSAYTYYIPYYARGDFYGTNAYSSLALRNSSGEEATVEIIYYAQSGAQVDTETRTIAAYGEDAFVIEDGEEGWIFIASDQPLTGLCWVGAIDGGWPWLMADVTLIPDLAFELIVPHVADDADWDTDILICNPHATPTHVTFRFVEDNGAIFSPYAIDLPPLGSAAIELEDILAPGPVILAPMQQLRSRGSVRILADQAVAAFAVYYDIVKKQGTCMAGISAVNPNALGLGYGMGEPVLGLR